MGMNTSRFHSTPIRARTASPSKLPSIEAAKRGGYHKNKNTPAAEMGIKASRIQGVNSPASSPISAASRTLAAAIASMRIFRAPSPA